MHIIVENTKYGFALKDGSRIIARITTDEASDLRDDLVCWLGNKED